MTDILGKLWSILTASEKSRMIVILAMMVISSLLEILGISLILPIIALLTKPELIEQNVYLKYIYGLSHASSHKSFIITISCALIVLYILKNVFMAFQYYVQARFIMSKGADLANRLFSNYINAPYTYWINTNSGHLLGNISLADLLAAYILLPVMALAAEILIVSGIFILLLASYPLITLGLIAVALVIMGVIYLPLKNANYRLGKEMKEEVLHMNKYALQGLNAFKEVKVRNKMSYFSEAYTNHRDVFNRIHSVLLFFRVIPRCLVEALAVSAGLTVLVLLVILNRSSGDIILTFSLFTASAVRMMPSLTRIQNSLTVIKQYSNSFHSLFTDIADFRTETLTSDGEIKFDNEIYIENITFSYPDSDIKIFDGFSLKIPKNTSVAFVGQTGCGKTTLIDIILGLLIPDAGKVKVDGTDIMENLSGWREKIGYVPQEIYLLDDTIAANVAFGESPADIDGNRVTECLELAQVHDFIEALPEKENTVVGENGVKLSGGQRQRLGIARALYHHPDVLILDEATSALDTGTESAFIGALEQLKGRITIILIAHRMSTVENCDSIIRLDYVSDENDSVN